MYYLYWMWTNYLLYKEGKLEDNENKEEKCQE